MLLGVVHCNEEVPGFRGCVKLCGVCLGVLLHLQPAEQHGGGGGGGGTGAINERAVGQLRILWEQA